MLTGTRVADGGLLFPNARCEVNAGKEQRVHMREEGGRGMERLRPLWIRRASDARSEAYAGFGRTSVHGRRAVMFAIAAAACRKIGFGFDAEGRAQQRHFG